MAGAAGMAGETSCQECAPYEACRAGQCVACSALDVTSFEAPESLGITGRYPRPSIDGLHYVDSGILWFLANDATAPFRITLGEDIKDSAPLYLPGLEALLPNLNFFFLRTDADGSLLRSAYFFATTPPTLGPIELAPELFSSEDGLNYSLAVSIDAARAWWRTTRSDHPGFMTAPLTGTAADAEPVAIEVRVGSKLCAASEADPTAWVTPDGALLLFRESILNEACEHPLGFSTDLFAVQLDATTGIPQAPASPIAVFRGGNARDSDPAFGPDCSLYFSSDAMQNGTYQLYRARRK